MAEISLLPPELLALRDQLRRAFEVLEPREGLTDAERVNALKKLDCQKYLAPKVDVRTVCVVREEMAYRDAATDSIFAVNGLGSPALLLAGGHEDTLKKLADGSALFAFALTEPEAGSDVASLTTQATRTADGYELSGHKRFISNAGVATHYTVFARTEEGTKGISAFAVPADAKGLKIRPMTLMGEHPIGELDFEAVRVPESARIGAEGAGLKLALSTLDVFRSTVGAAAIGMARRALDEALAYTQKRKQFGAPLLDQQAVQFLLAESVTELEASRLLVHRAAAAKDGGAERITYEAAVAKLFATESAQKIIDRCLQVHGGNGVVRGFAVERLYRDIRALRIYEGASEVQKLVIARHLAKEGRAP
ncbi:MAG: acyl-CoA dehydrogenase family protein [Myxococcaceae bacterium]